MPTPSKGKATKGKKPRAAGKLAGKTVAFVGKFGPANLARDRYLAYAREAGAKVVDAESAVPDYLVFGEGRGGNPPGAVAKVQKRHPSVQALNLDDFCLLLTPTRDELLREIRSGKMSQQRWEQIGELLDRSGGGDLSAANLRKAKLSVAILIWTKLDGADLRGVSARYAGFGDLRSVQCDGADFTHAYLVNAEDCSFRKANLTEAFLNFKVERWPPKYERCDFTGAKLRLASAEYSRFIDCTFVGADLSDTEIYKADFSGADLTGADLSRADGQKSKFGGANLARATLFRADLRGASLAKADLRHADLREAVLSGADLKGARIDGADFAGAVLTGAKLAGLDPSRAKNFRPPVARKAGPKPRDRHEVPPRVRVGVHALAADARTVERGW